MAINPAVVAAQNGIQHGHHSKMNLCGYDSFLHATICGGGTSHSPPPGTPTTTTTQLPQIVSNNQSINNNSNNTKHHQLIATVQPIMTTVPSNNSTPAKVFLNSTTHQIKTSKILRSGSYSLQQPHQSVTAHNSPQYHGYQRLSSSNAHHNQLQQQCSNKLAALHLYGAQLERSPDEHIEKWLKSSSAKNQRKDTPKNHENSLYAKLSERLQESTLNTPLNQHENVQRRKHKSAHRKRAAAMQNAAVKQEPHRLIENAGLQSSSSNASIGNYASLIPIHGDPAECENLIVPTTTDDEAANEAPSAVALATVTPDNRNIAESAKSRATAEDSKEKKAPVVSAAMDRLVDLSEDGELVAIEAVEAAIRVSDSAEVELDGEDCDEEDEEEQEEEDEESGGRGSAGNTSSGAASFIHRYVHEHIHHHYHHFEEKDE